MKANFDKDLLCKTLEVYALEVLKEFKDAFMEVRRGRAPHRREDLVENFKIAIDLYKSAKNQDLSAMTPEIATDLTIMELTKDKPDVRLLAYLTEWM